MYLWEKASEREYLSYGFMLCAMIAACFVKCKLGHIFCSVLCNLSGSDYYHVND